MISSSSMWALLSRHFAVCVLILIGQAIPPKPPKPTAFRVVFLRTVIHGAVSKGCLTDSTKVLQHFPFTSIRNHSTNIAILFFSNKNLCIPNFRIFYTI